MVHVFCERSVTDREKKYSVTHTSSRLNKQKTKSKKTYRTEAKYKYKIFQTLKIMSKQLFCGSRKTKKQIVNNSKKYKYTK